MNLAQQQHFGDRYFGEMPQSTNPQMTDQNMASLLARRDLMLANNADLEGDIKSLQYSSIAQRTSTIDMAQNPQESIPATQSQRHEQQQSAKQQANQMHMYRMEQDLGNMRNQVGGVRKQVSKRVGLSKKRNKSKEKVLQQSNQNRNIQLDIASQSGFSNPIANHDVLSAVENYHPVSPNSDPQTAIQKKTMVLWQDFQNLLQNQMLGQKVQQSNGRKKSSSSVRGKSLSKNNSPQKTRQNSKHRDQQQHQPSNQRDYLKQFDKQLDPDFVNSLSLFQQGIQDAIIKHHNQQSAKSSQKRRSLSSKKRKSKVKSICTAQQDQLKQIYRTTMKDLIQEKQDKDYMVDPAAFYDSGVQPRQGEQPPPTLQMAQQSHQGEYYAGLNFLDDNQYHQNKLSSNKSMKNSSQGHNSSGFPFRHSQDFKKATATFPEKSSIEDYGHDSKLGSSGIQRHEQPTKAHQRISIQKLADLENEIYFQQKKESSEGIQDSQNKHLSTPPLVASEPQLVIPHNNRDGFKPVSFANTNLQSRHSHQTQKIEGLVQRTLPVERATRGGQGERGQLEIDVKQFKKNRLSSRDSTEQSNVQLGRAKKINLPSYRDDRDVGPTQIVKDTDPSLSSKTNTQTGRNMVVGGSSTAGAPAGMDTQQMKSEELQAIPSDREEERSLENLEMAQNQQYIQQVPQNRAPVSIKFKRKSKQNDQQLGRKGLEGSQIGNGVEQGWWEPPNMFNMEHFGINDESTTNFRNQFSQDDQNYSKKRKKSPEELIDTVNRKYGILFGQNQPLVGIEDELRQMETEDFMRYLTSNDRANGRINRSSSHINRSAEKRVQIVGNSSSQLNLQIGQNPETAVDNLNNFIEQSIKRRYNSQPRKRSSSALRRGINKNNCRVHSLLNISNQRHQKSSTNAFQNKKKSRKVQFQDPLLRYAKSNRLSAKASKKELSLYRNRSENYLSQSNIRYREASCKLRQDQWRSVQKLPKNKFSSRLGAQTSYLNHAIISLTPHAQLKQQNLRRSQTSLQRCRRADRLKNNNVENDWDREEISKQKYNEYLKEKNRIKQRRDPWMPQQRPDISPPQLNRSSGQQQCKSEEKYALNDQYKKVVLDLWKEVKQQNKVQIQSNVKPDRFKGETQQSLFRKSQNQMARIRAIQNKLRPFVFQRFSDFYQINKNNDANIEIQKRVQALTLNEQILHSIDFDLLQVDIEIIRLRLLNALMLLKTFQQAGDDLRVIRFMQESTDKNLYLPSLLKKLSQTDDLGELDLQNYVLFIYQLYGESLIRKSHNQEAKSIFYDVCKVYNRWKINNGQLQDIFGSVNKNQRVFEFGIDDYIRAKASYAESIMNCGQIDHAIDKFENTKKTIENEIIYENPMIYVNVCNQLANCYLKCQDTIKALQNFEISLSMISKIEAEKQGQIGGAQSTDTNLVDRVSPLVIAKICLNIAIIRSQMGQHDEAVFMHQKSLNYKSQVLPQLHDEIRDQNILLAFAQQRANMPEQACQTLNRALQIHKTHNNPSDYKAAQLYSQLANGYLKSNQIQEAISNYEHACMILLKIEQNQIQKKEQQSGGKVSGTNNLKQTQKDQNGKDEQRCVSKLDKIYIQLLDLYLQTSNQVQANQVMSALEIRLESLSNTDEYAYRMMNELANLLQKHQLYSKSINYYKKALLCMKRRHKNLFNQQPETAKILINIASVLYTTNNIAESLKSFSHALEVLSKILLTFQRFDGDLSQFQQLYNDALVEKGRVHLTCSQIHDQIANKEQATLHYNKAFECFEQVQNQTNSQDFIKDQLLAA